MPGWQQKVALVTGGASGLGLAIARRFGLAGARVALAGRDAGRLDVAVQLLSSAGITATRHVADVTRREQVEGLVASVVDAHARLDVLVNNVGRSSRGEAWQTSVEEFQELWETNFLSAVHGVRSAISHLEATRGHIVNIGSLAAKSAGMHLGAYPATKFPLAAYSQQLRMELAPRGIHVLLVCPGPIERDDAGRRYEAQAADLPPAARLPGGGVRLRRINPDDLAVRIVRACESRRAELIVPGKARWLFAISQLWPAIGDWLLRQNTSDRKT